MIAVLFGPPGSGKGTQAAFITRDFDMAHVSTGDMLRAEAATGSPLGREVAPLMAAGKLVPDDLIVRVIAERLGHDDVRKGVILDGFPRTVAQARALDTMLKSKGRDVGLILSLDVPVDDLVERLLGRAREQGRVDDTAEVIRERMHEYQRKTAPVLDHYRRSGARVATVDGVGSIDEVRGRVSEEVAGALGRAGDREAMRRVADGA
ncbi:MAG TPA: adenylate kinase [Candidatus Dormibacteraeota bacterium]